MTDAQRRALVDVSDGEWRNLAMYHDAGVVGTLRKRGLIRCDFDHLSAHEKNYTITPNGIAALEVWQ